VYNVSFFLCKGNSLELDTIVIAAFRLSFLGNEMGGLISLENEHCAPQCVVPLQG
jgi:hypothetical protein